MGGAHRKLGRQGGAGRGYGGIRIVRQSRRDMNFKFMLFLWLFSYQDLALQRNNDCCTTVLLEGYLL